MLRATFDTLIYEPLYNALVYIVAHIPGHDIGIAVIIVTILVRVILYPLSRRAILAQMAMKEMAPEIEALRKKHADKPEEQARAIFALYRARNIHPLSGFLLLLVQLPILIGLYLVFAYGGFPMINAEILYPFVDANPAIQMKFLGLIDMAGQSVTLSILAAVVQLVYTRLTMGPPGAQNSAAASGTFAADFAKSFETQARYVLPLMIGFFAYFIAAAAPLYWITSNLFMIGQELLAGRRFSGVIKK